MHIHITQNDGTDEPVWREQWRHRHREQTYGHGEGQEEEGGMFGENNMETCTLPYVK